MRTGLKHAKVAVQRGWLSSNGPLVGTALCGLAALAVSALAAGHSWKTVVPLLFSAVLLVVAFVFGMRAGILGSVVAAVVFASFLFSPVRSIHVTSEAARSNLGWMVLIGISFSLLFAPPSSGFGRR
jgi:K+-sensing histidine kinase KdpD